MTRAASALVAGGCQVVFLDIPERHWSLVVKRQQSGMEEFFL
jgi:hypothetical protein